MAPSLLPLILLISVLAATASCRPCKPLFYFSTTATTTYYPYKSYSGGNPNTPNSLHQIQDPRYFTFVFTGTSRFRDLRPSFNFNPNPTVDDELHSSPSDFPLNLYSSVSSSIRDRTKDIISVVGALLFGFGCGALTAAIMYFVWALFSPHSFDFDDVASSSEDDDDDITSAKKKFGYVSVPSNTKMVDVDDLKKPAPPAKDLV